MALFTVGAGGVTFLTRGVEDQVGRPAAQLVETVRLP